MLRCPLLLLLLLHSLTPYLGFTLPSHRLFCFSFSQFLLFRSLLSLFFCQPSLALFAALSFKTRPLSHPRCAQRYFWRCA
jgi:hypothetical protein